MKGMNYNTQTWDTRLFNIIKPENIILQFKRKNYKFSIGSNKKIPKNKIISINIHFNAIFSNVPNFDQ